MSPRRAKAVTGRVGDDPAVALRELLIDAAEHLLARGSVSSITTREIAREAGLSDGVLYNYFADKNELILAALLRRYTTLAARLEHELPVPGEETVEANLCSLLRALLRLFGEAMPTVAGLMTEPALLHRLMEEIHNQVLSPQQMQAKLVEYLLAEQRLGRLPAGIDVAPVGVLLMGAVSVLTFAVTLGPLPGPDAVDRQIDGIVATLMRGLAPAR